MTNDTLNEYFSMQGIDVSYNTVNGSEDLIESYVTEFQTIVGSSTECKSQNVKYTCYNKLYMFKPRPKFTGFENFKKIDREFRRQISPLIKKSQFSPTMIIDPGIPKNVQMTFKDALKKKVQSFKDPVLYLSGGLDSELVALAMLDAGVKFTPVIFDLVDNQQKILNAHDNQYAYEFCQEHGLLPIAKTINIEELWQSRDFAELAIDLQIVSPHLVTHAYMVKLMDSVLPGRAHVFGGEVRFYTNHQLDDGRMANLVLLAKTAPLYNGATYVASSSTATSASQQLNYKNDGTWEVSGTGDLFDSDSGTWTTTPGSTYEFRIVSRSIIGGSSGTNYLPTATPPTAWSTIGASTLVCFAQAYPPGPIESLDITFGIEVRTASGAQQGIVQSSTIAYYVEYSAT